MMIFTPVLNLVAISFAENSELSDLSFLYLPDKRDVSIPMLSYLNKL
jgi:hypothetical protein